MGIVGTIARHRKAVASGLGIALLAGVPVTFAVLHEGFPVSDVELEARDVWVTNGSALLGGRLNSRIEEIDGAVSGRTPTLDVLQNGSDVFLVDADAGQIARVDPAYTSLVEPSEIPVGSEVALGGDTLAIVSPAGALWVVDVSNALVFDPAAAPVVDLGPGGGAVVTPTGAVLATSPDAQAAYHIPGPGALPESRDFPVPRDGMLAAVGERLAVFDPEQNVLYRDDGSRTDLPAAALRLQQSGESAAEAVLATGDSLLFVDLGSGGVREVAADLAAPVGSALAVSAPVVVDGCAHGAWGGAQRYLLVCAHGEGADGAAPDVAREDGARAFDIAQRTQGSRLEFRVNGSVVALNDLTTGNVWLPAEEMRLVDNWEEVTPPEEEETDDGDDASSTQSFEDTLAERTEVNRPPVARDDSYGVRAGRTTIIPVLSNDTDPDGDVLVIPRVSDLPAEVGILDVIDGGRALQFTPALGATGATFRYTVDDGRAGGVAEAQATVRVAPEAENSAPVEERTTAVSVEVGGTIGYNVLADWIDPDGDDILLEAASPASADTVRFTPDGVVTFEHTSGTSGTKEVTLVVSDGELETVGTLLVQVEPAGSLTPVGTPDYTSVFAGEAVALTPLENDVSPSGAALTLLGVDQVPSAATVIPQLERGTLTFQAPTPGSYYFTYQLAAGAATSVGLIRVEVLPDPGSASPPVAVKDTAFLRAGEPTVVAVLANDVSPDGRVIAVQSVDAAGAASGLSVEVLGNTVVRVTSSAALTGQTQFRYTISDGISTATAGVTVVPVPPIVNRQPPVALDDRVRVRAGDYVTADVLANDHHPDQGLLRLDPELVDVSAAGGGLAFVGGGAVRYQAGAEPGEYSVVYRVSDQYGESATARVTFVVVAPDPESNQAPVPLPQTARVFAGATVPIVIPLDGIDPDGDSVVIADLATPPTLGTITGRSATAIEYTADAGAAGTDTFGYVVEDAYGVQALGTITVGVVPRPAVASPPNAVDDAVQMRPGRTATVAVLLNDSDPNGYPLTLDPELVEADPGIATEVDGSDVVLVAPDEPGAFTLRYGISNGHGGTDSAFLQVEVTDDAPPVPPAADDLVIPIDDVVGVDELTVSLDTVIASPAGRTDELVLSIEGPNAGLATVDPEARTVTVRPGDRRTAIAYRVENPDDGLQATAFILVPPAVGPDYAPPPRLRDDLEQQVVDMDGAAEWDLADIVYVPSGRDPILADDAVTATHADGGDLVVDGDTIRFAPTPGYRGPAAITFRVTDGATPDDPGGNTALLSMPLVVGDPDFTDTPPQFVTQTLAVEAGEAPTTLDLRAATTHPNPALASRFSYGGLTGATADIAAGISGGDLVVSAPFGVQPGTTTALDFTVRFGEFEVPGRVTVTVVSSTRPLAQAVADAAKGQRSVPDTVNVLGNDYNPFPGETLRVVDARIENAAETSASMTFTPTGEISLQPDAAFIGTISVVYEIEDATRDPDRRVTGRLQYTVRDVPGRPAAPTVIEGDEQVTVEWDAPATNGEPISQYTISWSGGAAVTVPGSAASHTFTGLANGTGFTFQVRASNVLGAGQVSAASATATPYGAPFPVTSATATGSTNGSGDVILSWGGASGNGRAITGYRIVVTPGGATYDVGNVTTTTVPGRVGTAYGYTITTLGPGGQSSAFSSTGTGTPAPGAPAVSANWPGPRGTTTVNVTWTAAASTEPIAGYEVSINNGAWIDVGTATSYSFDGQFDTGYTVRVRATSAGITGPAGVSNTVTPLDVLPPSYTLCYHNDYGGYYNIGIRYANTSAGITLRADAGVSSGVTTGSSGTVRLQSWHAGGAGDGVSDNDDNAMIGIYVNGSLHSTTRWGNAPAC